MTMSSVDKQQPMPALRREDDNFEFLLDVEDANEDAFAFQPNAALSFPGTLPPLETLSHPRTVASAPAVCTAVHHSNKKRKTLDSIAQKYPTAEEVIDYLFWESKRGEKSIIPPTTTPVMTTAAVVSPPAMARYHSYTNKNQEHGHRYGCSNHNNQECAFLPSSDFVDGHEMERTVQVDSTSNRAYVYSIDLTTQGLPEFLFLDVPNDAFAASLCGRYITNQVAQALKEDLAQAPEHKHHGIIKSCDLEMYQQDIFIPHTPDGSVGEVVSVKFRLRAARPTTKLQEMLRCNFFNGHRCPNGIVVFLPCIKPKSPFHAFWGNAATVRAIPEHDEYINRNRLDSYCFKIATHHGKFCGGIPISTLEDSNLISNRVKERGEGNIQIPLLQPTASSLTKKPPTHKKRTPITLKAKRDFAVGKKTVVAKGKKKTLKTLTEGTDRKK